MASEDELKLFEHLDITQFPKHWAAWISDTANKRRALHMLNSPGNPYQVFYPYQLYFKVEEVWIPTNFKEQLEYVHNTLARSSATEPFDLTRYVNLVVDEHVELQWPLMSDGTRARRPVLEKQQPVSYNDAYRSYIKKNPLTTDSEQTGSVENLPDHEKAFKQYNHFGDIQQAPNWWARWYNSIERKQTPAVDVYEFYYTHYGLELATLPTNLHLDPLRDEIIKAHQKFMALRSKKMVLRAKDLEIHPMPLDDVQVRFFPIPSYEHARSAYFDNQNWSTKDATMCRYSNSIDDKIFVWDMKQFSAELRLEKAKRQQQEAEKLAAEQEAEQVHPSKAARTESYAAVQEPSSMDIDDETRHSDIPMPPNPTLMELDEDSKDTGPTPPPPVAAGHPVPPPDLAPEFNDLKTQMYFYVDSSVAPLFMMDGNMIADEMESQTEYKLSEGFYRIKKAATLYDRRNTSSAAVLLQALWGARKHAHEENVTKALDFVMSVLGRVESTPKFFKVAFKPQSGTAVWRMYVCAPFKVQLAPNSFVVRDHIAKWSGDTPFVVTQLSRTWDNDKHRTLVRRAADHRVQLPEEVTVHVGITPAIIKYMQLGGYQEGPLKQLKYDKMEAALSAAYVQAHKSLGVERCRVIIFNVLDMFRFDRGIEFDPAKLNSVRSLSTVCLPSDQQEDVKAAMRKASDLLLNQFNTVPTTVPVRTTMNVFLHQATIHRAITTNTKFILGKYAFPPPQDTADSVQLYDAGASATGSVHVYVSHVVEENSKVPEEPYIVPAGEVVVPNEFIDGIVKHFHTSPDQSLSFKLVVRERNPAGNRAVQNPVTFTVPGSTRKLGPHQAWTLELREYVKAE